MSRAAWAWTLCTSAKSSRMSSALHNHEAAWQHVDIDPVDPHLDALYHRKQTAARSELRRLRPGHGPFGGTFENALLHELQRVYEHTKRRV